MTARFTEAYAFTTPSETSPLAGRTPHAAKTG